MNTSLAYTPRDDIDAMPVKDPALARAGLQHIHIGLNTTVKATRERPERERLAIRWLANYISREKLTADDVCEHLKTDVTSVRAAFTNPDADVKQIVARIESLRAVLDSNLVAPAATEFVQAASKAFRFAMKNGALCEFVDLTRTGKTTVADWMHLTHLDRAIYVNCPHTESYASFIIAVARGCGIAVGSGKKGNQIPDLQDKIRSMMGRGGFDLLIIDEGHYLWPTNIAGKPKRIEFLRGLWDEKKRQLAVVILSTPQAILSSNQALTASKRWSPGQWEGRINRFYPPAKAKPEDMEKVARWHCPEGNTAIIHQLVMFAKVSSGYYGAMVNVLDRARFEAEEAGEKLTVEHIKAAQAEAIKGTALEKALTQGAKP